MKEIPDCRARPIAAWRLSDWSDPERGPPRLGTGPTAWMMEVSSAEGRSHDGDPGVPATDAGGEEIDPEANPAAFQLVSDHAGSGSCERGRGPVKVTVRRLPSVSGVD